MANMSKRVSLVGKGDRPRKVNQKKFAENYERIFDRRDEPVLEKPRTPEDRS